jgi:hypothetical protein
VYGLRYHLASLAAVLLALVIGVFLGAGINDRGLTNKAARALLERRVELLSHQLDSIRATSSASSRDLHAAEAYISETYPTLMADRLRGKRIVIVFVGAVDGTLQSDVEQALRDAGVSQALRLRALKVPVDARQIDASLALARRTQPTLARYLGDAKLGTLGSALATELMAGESRLWQTLNEQVVEERAGSDVRPGDGVVVVQTAPAQHDQTAAFLRGFYTGLTSAGTPVVVVQPSSPTLGAPSLYGASPVSVVDDIDKPAGRLALALLLAGGPTGHYGVKSSATNGILPPLAPKPVFGG